MLKNILFLAFITAFSLLQANKIDDKIVLNKKILQSENKNKKSTTKIIKNLVFELKKEELLSDDLEQKISVISNSIFLNKIKLKKSKNQISILNKKSLDLKKNTKTIENNLVESISQKYSVSLSKSLINKQSLSDIINKERYDIILDNAKEKILKSNLNYFKVENDKRKNNEQTSKLEKYIHSQEEKKREYKSLQKKHSNSIKNLQDKHQRYQNVLKLTITKQENLNSLLQNLDILKKKKEKKAKLKKIKALFKKEKEKRAKLKKEKEKAKKEELAKKNKKRKNIKISKKNKAKSSSKNIKIIAKQEFVDKIDLNVRNIGSSTKGISVSNYKGAKTMSPLKSYKVVKKFGKYYDDVYKIELFNESVSLKSKTKNAKVLSVLKGKVIYAKTNQGALGSVVIVKHAKNLHTVYSQLSNIPSSLKVGKWIPKGYVVGRVYDTLVFQATKNNRYINPIKLFK